MENDPLERVEASQTGDVNLEDAFQSLFKTSASGTGEEELLRIASTFSMQLSTRQMKALLYLEMLAGQSEEPVKSQLRNFVSRWLELKQHNNSDMFVMRALDAISLRKFVGENAFKVNIEK
jgi:hypothetical protein